MIIARPVLSRAIARLRLMKLFPGSDPDVLAALGAELSEMCQTDAELQKLVAEVTGNYEQWPGIRQVRETAGEIRGQAEAAEYSKRNLEACRAHSANCPGYTVEIDTKCRTVAANFCKERFETHGYWGSADYVCFAGHKLRDSDPDFTKRLLDEELAKRPDYESLGAHRKRSDEEFARKRRLKSLQ